MIGAKFAWQFFINQSRSKRPERKTMLCKPVSMRLPEVLFGRCLNLGVFKLRFSQKQQQKIHLFYASAAIILNMFQYLAQFVAGLKFQPHSAI